MPESVTDRPTSSHEKLFLMSKAPKYFYDAEAVRLPATGRAEPLRFGKPPDRQDNERTYQADGSVGANLRNLWTIATHAYSEAHFATFPPKLVEPCIKAGTSEQGVCGECGAPWVRVISRGELREHPGRLNRNVHAGGDFNGEGYRENGGTLGMVRDTETTGWRPICDHDARTIPATCLDPFAGAGTVGLVADRLGRDAILIKISSEYAEMARRRIYDDAPLFAEVR